MDITYSDLKMCVKKTKVFLPYRWVFEELLGSRKIGRFAHSAISDTTILDYTGKDIMKDILAIRKNYYIVSVGADNLPNGWLRFNEVLHDLSIQCEKNISFYVPYYDLNAAMYFRDFSKLKIQKRIIIYPPEKHYRKEDASMAVKELEANGFSCIFSKDRNHAKAYIFDDQAAVIGSFNFTGNGIYENNELGSLIFGRDVEVLKSFLEKREFEL